MEAVNMARRSGWDKLALFVNVQQQNGLKEVRESAMKSSRSSLWNGSVLSEGETVNGNNVAQGSNQGNAGHNAENNMQWISGAVVGVAVVAASAFVLAKWK
jgi:hypothetical protein